MTTDTSKITGAADELSAGLTKGGTAAKTLGAEIANAIKSLDSRVAALESAPAPIPPDPVPPDTGGPTGGLITQFTGTKGGRCRIDNIDCYNQSVGKPYSQQNPDPHTIRYEIRAGDHIWSSDSDISENERMPRYPSGTALKLAYRIMFEPGSPQNADWFVCGEWHNNDGQTPGGVATSPPVVCELVGEKFSFIRRSCRPGGNPGNASGSDMVQVRAWTQPQNMERGHWYVIEEELKFDQTNGYLRIKFDGQQIVNYTGPLGYGCETYWMQGLYRQTGGPNIAAHFKNVTMDPLQV